MLWGRPEYSHWQKFSWKFKMSEPWFKNATQTTVDLISTVAGLWKGWDWKLWSFHICYISAVLFLFCNFIVFFLEDPDGQHPSPDLFSDVVCHCTWHPCSMTAQSVCSIWMQRCSSWFLIAGLSEIVWHRRVCLFFYFCWVLFQHFNDSILKVKCDCPALHRCCFLSMMLTKTTMICALYYRETAVSRVQGA